MPPWLLLLWDDVSDAVLELRFIDFAQPTFFAMWLIILYMPLIGVDRRDPIAGLDFILYSMASGAALVFALPQELIEPPTTKFMMVVISSMGIAAGVRWVVGASRQAKEEEEAKSGRSTIENS